MPMIVMVTRNVWRPTIADAAEQQGAKRAHQEACGEGEQRKCARRFRC